jgi:hypothetical protein
MEVRLWITPGAERSKYINKKKNNMRIYRVIIRADRYPTEYNVQASSWSPAVSRGVKEWQKRFRGKKVASGE